MLLTVTKVYNIVANTGPFINGVWLCPIFTWSCSRLMKKQCDRCSGKFFRRLNRKGFLERNVLPPLGFFPWECALCRRKILLRNDGFKVRAKVNPVLATQPGTLASLAFAGRKHRQ